MYHFFINKRSLSLYNLLNLSLTLFPIGYVYPESQENAQSLKNQIDIQLMNIEKYKGSTLKEQKYAVMCLLLLDESFVTELVDKKVLSFLFLTQEGSSIKTILGDSLVELIISAFEKGEDAIGNTWHYSNDFDRDDIFATQQNILYPTLQTFFIQIQDWFDDAWSIDCNLRKNFEDLTNRHGAPKELLFAINSFTRGLRNRIECLDLAIPETDRTQKWFIEKSKKEQKQYETYEKNLVIKMSSQNTNSLAFEWQVTNHSVNEIKDCNITQSPDSLLWLFNILLTLPEITFDPIKINRFSDMKTSLSLHIITQLNKREKYLGNTRREQLHACLRDLLLSDQFLEQINFEFILFIFASKLGSSYMAPIHIELPVFPLYELILLIFEGSDDALVSWPFSEPSTGKALLQRQFTYDDKTIPLLKTLKQEAIILIERNEANLINLQRNPDLLATFMTTYQERGGRIICELMNSVGKYNPYNALHKLYLTHQADGLATLVRNKQNVIFIHLDMLENAKVIEQKQNITTEDRNTFNSKQSSTFIQKVNLSLGGTITNVPGDGSCFFHAVATSIEKNELLEYTRLNMIHIEERHTILRKRAIKYIEQHKDRFSPFFTDTGECLENYLIRMAEPTEYAEEYIIDALALSCDICFCIQSVKCSLHPEQGFEIETVHKINDDVFGMRPVITLLRIEYPNNYLNHYYVWQPQTPFDSTPTECRSIDVSAPPAVPDNSLIHIHSSPTTPPTPTVPTEPPTPRQFCVFPTGLLFFGDAVIHDESNKNESYELNYGM